MSLLYIEREHAVGRFVKHKPSSKCPCWILIRYQTMKALGHHNYSLVPVNVEAMPRATGVRIRIDRIVVSNFFLPTLSLKGRGMDKMRRCHSARGAAIKKQQLFIQEEPRATTVPTSRIQERPV